MRECVGTCAEGGGGGARGGRGEGEMRGYCKYCKEGGREGVGEGG